MNNILLKVINDNFSTLQFNTVLILFLRCLTFCAQCCLVGHHPPECSTILYQTLYVHRNVPRLSIGRWNIKYYRTHQYTTGWISLILTHCGPVMQICAFRVFALQLWKTDDAKLPFNTRLVFTHLIHNTWSVHKIVLQAGFKKKNVTLLWINDLW
jgi:hypothetical protein